MSAAAHYADKYRKNKYSNSYEYQRVKYWARKIKECTPEELNQLIEDKDPGDDILEKARKYNELP